MNEKAVGRGMKKSGMEREKIYLSTKLWPSEYADADRAIDDTLRRLDTDYIDLLFLHQPVGDYVAAYQAMERAVKAGNDWIGLPYRGRCPCCTAPLVYRWCSQCHPQVAWCCR